MSTTTNSITTAQAAARLGITSRRVVALIKANRLPASKFGRDWMIDESDLNLVKVRISGYPKGKPRIERRLAKPAGDKMENKCVFCHKVVPKDWYEHDGFTSLHFDGDRYHWAGSKDDGCNLESLPAHERCYDRYLQKEFNIA